MEISADGLAGETIPLPLGSGGATGYSWVLDLPDGVTRIPHPEIQAKTDDLVAGDAAPGPAVFVQADKPGVYHFRARLARPWEEDGIRSIDVTLSVG
ncbi:MAG TPA: protease inhibitor I42 family protein [Microbacteriaceae bacterium]